MYHSAINEKHQTFDPNYCICYHNNAFFHTELSVKQFLAKKKKLMLEHPLYTLNLYVFQ
jgi:hypothetical protein